MAILIALCASILLNVFLILLTYSLSDRLDGAKKVIDKLLNN